MASTPPIPPDPPGSLWPAPRWALALFAAALLVTLGAALVASAFAVPKSAYVLAVMAAVLGVGIGVGRRHPLSGWLIGGAVAALGVLAGAYSLVMLPESMIEGEPPTATLARAATALVSGVFLLRLLVVVRNRLRRRATPGPLAPLPWR